MKNVPSLILLIISCLPVFLGVCDNGVIFCLTIVDKTGALNECVRSVLIPLGRCVPFNYFPGFATALIKFPFRRRDDK